MWTLLIRGGWKDNVCLTLVGMSIFRQELLKFPMSFKGKYSSELFEQHPAPREQLETNANEGKTEWKKKLEHMYLIFRFQLFFSHQPISFILWISMDWEKMLRGWNGFSCQRQGIYLNPWAVLAIPFCLPERTLAFPSYVVMQIWRQQPTVHYPLDFIDASEWFCIFVSVSVRQGHLNIESPQIFRFVCLFVCFKILSGCGSYHAAHQLWSSS